MKYLSMLCAAAILAATTFATPSAGMDATTEAQNYVRYVPSGVKRDLWFFSGAGGTRDVPTTGKPRQSMMPDSTAGLREISMELHLL